MDETERQRARDLREIERLKLLRKDKKLNRQFDANLKSAAAPKEKVLKKRRRGRPKDGRVVFQQKRIDSLPDIGYTSEIARSLGITHTTLQQWCAMTKHPLPSSTKDGERLFRKDVLIKWLVATKRYKIKPEYQEE